METAKILVVDDEQIALKNLVHILKKVQGYEVTGSQSGPRAVALLEEHEFDVILTDLKIPVVDGMEIMKRAKALSPDTEVIIITGYATVDSAIEAMKGGAYHYVTKPYKLDEVRKVVAEALEKRRLKLENQRLRHNLDQVRGVTIISEEPQMLKLLDTARQVARSDCSVLITGESGTGKELLARFLHENGPRAGGPIVAVNCGVFTEELLSNELFGHEKGAFTGADRLKIGLIEAANSGTLFLDEISEMPLPMQVKLLRVLQEREVLRLGATQPRRVDVRFVAATNRDLHAMVQEGQFRQDLYFRINVVNLHLPALAARRRDVPLLARFFLDKYSVLMGKRVSEISPDAMALLQSYEFPGNIRELENIIERAVVLARGDRIEVGHLPDMQVQTFRPRDDRMPSLDEHEQDYIAWVLEQTSGNKTKAAEILGIDRVSLWRKLKKAGLE